MFKSGGMVHVVYYPEFIREGGIANIDDLIAHIDDFCFTQGRKTNSIDFYDFDGISSFLKLEDASQSQHLIDKLLDILAEEDVKGFSYQNFLDHRPKDIY